VFETTDGGKTWKLVGSFTDAKPVLIDPHDAKVVYAVVVGAVYRGTIGSTSWRKLSPPLAIEALAADPRHANVLYGGTIRDGVLRSSNGGRSWRPFNRGLTSHRVQSLAI